MSDRSDPPRAGQEGDPLAPYVAAARAARATPDEALLARILADAAVIGQEHAEAARPAPLPVARRSFWHRWGLAPDIAVPVLGCLVVGLSIGLTGGADPALLSGIETVSGTGDVLVLGFDGAGMELLELEAGS